MAITPPWALHVGAPNCFNRPTAIAMATTVTAGATRELDQGLIAVEEGEARQLVGVSPCGRN